MLGWLCDRGKCVNIPISNIEPSGPLGLNGTYKGKQVYRKKGCYGLCDNQIKKSDSTSLLVVTVLLSLILLFFFSFLANRSKISKYF
jgi:hypothetical protein